MKKQHINIQLFGPDFPPYYDEMTELELVRKITEYDEKINTLFVERYEYVKALEKKVK